MSVHVPVIRVFGLGAVVLIVLAVALGISAIARRRGLARLRAMRQPMRAAPPFVVPVSQPRECRSMARFVWAIVIGLVAVAALSQTVLVRPVAVPATLAEADAVWVPEPPTVRVVQIQPPEVRPAVPQRKARAWFKPNKPTPVEPPHQWKGEIERVSIAPEADSPEAKLRTLQEGLTAQLNLRVPPPVRFFETPAYFRIDDTKTDLVKHDPDIGDYVRVRYEVEVTNLGWQELSRLERADRSGERMEESARWLGLLTVLLGAVAAYVRLDEWTKGYYSGRLFLVAAAVVVCLGVPIIWA